MKLSHAGYYSHDPGFLSLFVVSRSMKNFFSIDYVNIYLFSTFLAIDFQHCLYHDLLTLKTHSQV